MTAPRPPRALLARLLDVDSAQAAAASLAANPAWFGGQVPPEALAAFADPRHPEDGAVLGLAFAWDPDTLISPLLDAVANESEAPRRRRLAWIAKQIATPAATSTLLALASSPSEDRVVRRYLLEALARLGFGGELPWPRIASPVRVLMRDPDALVREAAIALAGIGEGDDAERRAVLVQALTDPEAAVLATAVTALRRFALRKADLPADMYHRLYDHPDPTVRLAFRELVAGAARDWR